MALSFPYPQQGTIVRPHGQGCSTCVHQGYCQAFYWYYRYEQFPGADTKRKPVDDHLGIQCAPWSNNPADRITTITQDDLKENERLAVTEAILMEPFRNGMTDPVTANAHED